jgi:acetate kinase
LDAHARGGSSRRARLDLALLSGRILVVNAGSTSLKLHLVEDDHATKVESLAQDVRAVVHRVVHGGARFRDPVLIDDDVRDEIRTLEEIAPLHNEPALRAIDEARRAVPDVPHVAVFDTAFHGTIPEEAATYAIPREWRERGIRRYGFHGLSVEWAAERVRVPRLVVCHLGGGCSVTAVRDGRSVDTTMGFSPLEGVPMTTRAGSVDPGALVYLLHRGLALDELDHALNHESGLRGLANVEGMRELEAAGSSEARLALDVFTHRVAAAVAAMATACGGLDALVFTAGIGENSSHVRELVCARLGFLGVELDLRRNANAAPDSDVAAAASRVGVAIVQAREEIVAARAARSLLQRSAQSFSGA